MSHGGDVPYLCDTDYVTWGLARTVWGCVTSTTNTLTQEGTLLGDFSCIVKLAKPCLEPWVICCVGEFPSRLRIESSGEAMCSY